MAEPARAPSNKAQKLLDRTRRTGAGWGQSHYARLFAGFGFLTREGGNHTIYWDPDEKSNRVQVPRHGELKAWVAKKAVEAIDRKLRREGLDL